ncbi:hypothetical protein GEMRC1_010222 [Eukaryota sp. GEM-RC1]
MLRTMLELTARLLCLYLQRISGKMLLIFPSQPHQTSRKDVEDHGDYELNRKRLLKDAKQPEATQKDHWEANDLWSTSDAVEASFSVSNESDDTDWCPEDVFLSSEDSTDM